MTGESNANLHSGLLGAYKRSRLPERNWKTGTKPAPKSAKYVRPSQRRFPMSKKSYTKGGMHHTLPSPGDAHSAGKAPTVLAHNAANPMPGGVPKARPGSACDPGEVTSGQVPGLAMGSTMDSHMVTGSDPTPSEFKGRF